MERRVRPALAAGAWVLCDRFIDSTMAYQGLAGGVGREAVDWLRRFATDGLTPDLTIMLDVPVELGLARAAARVDGKQRFELRDAAFHQRLRAAFQEIARDEPGRCQIVDGSVDADGVAAAIRDLVAGRFGLVLK